VLAQRLWGTCGFCLPNFQCVQPPHPPFPVEPLLGNAWGRLGEPGMVASRLHIDSVPLDAGWLAGWLGAGAFAFVGWLTLEDA
jgi:hypothetical protein